MREDDRQTGTGISTAAVRGAWWLAADQVGSRVIDLAFTVVLVRLLMPDDFGLLALAASSTAFFRLFANLGLAAAIVQRQDVDDEDLATAFWANLASGIVLFGIIAASGAVFGTVLRDHRVSTLMLVLSLRFVIASGSATQVAMLSRRLNYKALTLRSIAGAMIGGIVGSTLAVLGLGVWSLVGQELARTLSNTVLLYRATRWWRPAWQFSWSRFRVLWSFGGPILLSRLFGYLVRNMDNLLIGRYLGAAALGLYSLGYAFFAVPLNDFAAIIHRVMFSALSRVQGEQDRFRRGFLQASRYVAMVLIPAMIGLAVVAGPLVNVLFGTKWLQAAPVISILALAAVVTMMTALAPSGMQATGRADLHLQGSVLAVLVYIPAFAIGLRWGVVGVAMGYLAGTLLLAPIGYRLLTRATGVSFGEIWLEVFPSLGCSLVMAAVVVPARWLLQAANVATPLALGVLIVLGICVYWGAAWTVQRQSILALLRLLRDSVFPTPRRLITEPD